MKINSAGCYLVRFFVNGVQTGVMVDDKFLCNKNNNSLVFSKCRENEWWVPIVEKAYAKLLGSYVRQTCAYMSNVLLSIMTNAPSKCLIHASIKDHDKFWE